VKVEIRNEKLFFQFSSNGCEDCQQLRRFLMKISRVRVFQGPGFNQ
jgi:thioredoxin-related protein